MGPLPIFALLLLGGTEAPPPPTGNPGSTPSANSGDLGPITGEGRLVWAIKGTIGPGSLFVGVVQAGWGNLLDRPPEYREGMEGFGKRFGLRLSSVGTSNVMEASLGAIWGEDPRYHVSHAESARGRFGHALKMTFMANKTDGTVAPAYARYIAFAGSNAISDAWRPDSQKNVASTMTRIGERFAGRFLGNVFKEYWPEVKQHVFKR